MIEALLHVFYGLLAIVAVGAVLCGYIAWRNARRRQDEAAEVVRQAEAIAKAAGARNGGSGGGGGTIEPA